MEVISVGPADTLLEQIFQRLLAFVTAMSTCRATTIVPLDGHSTYGLAIANLYRSPKPMLSEALRSDK